MMQKQEHDPSQRTNQTRCIQNHINGGNDLTLSLSTTKREYTIFLSCYPATTIASMVQLATARTVSTYPNLDFVVLKTAVE